MSAIHNNTTINTIIEPVRPTQCDIIQSVALLVFASIPVVLLCCIAKVVSSEELQKLADKIHAIVIYHPFVNLLGLLDSDSLTFSKNMATQEVMWNEEDVKKGEEYLGALGFEGAPNIGAETTGVCVGATLWIIKDLLSHPVESEEDLIKVTGKYYRGFPAEAAGMQTAHHVLRNSLLDRMEAIQADKAWNDPRPSEVDIVDLNSRLRKLLQDKEESVSTLYNFFGLKKSAGTDLSQPGLYQILKDRHATSYLHFSFGTYIFDPNKGLSRCGTVPTGGEIAAFQLKLN